MPETTFTRTDLTTFLGLDALGLTAVGQLLTAKRAVIEYHTPTGFEDPFCGSCGPKEYPVGRCSAPGPRAGELEAHTVVSARPDAPIVCQGW